MPLATSLVSTVGISWFKIKYLYTLFVLFVVLFVLTRALGVLEQNGYGFYLAFSVASVIAAFLFHISYNRPELLEDFNITSVFNICMTLALVASLRVYYGLFGLIL